MSQSPTYYFTNIQYNNAFFKQSSTSSSGVGSLSLYKTLFLDKQNADSTTGNIIKFASPTTFNNWINVYSPASNPSLIFKNSSFSSNNTFFTSSTTDLTIQMMYAFSPIGMKVLQNSIEVFYLNTTGKLSSTRLNYVFSSSPTRLSSQIGFNYSNTTLMSTGNISTAGDYYSYGAFNNIPLSVGRYLLVMNFGISSIASPVGVLNSFEMGYTLGTSTTPSSNANYLTLASPNLSTTDSFSGSMNYNFCYKTMSVVNVGTNNSYVHPYVLGTILVTFTNGSCRVLCSSYSFCRIG